MFSTGGLAARWQSRSVESIFDRALAQHAAGSSAEEKRELLSRLLARLAHEIRNPLSSLHIHVQLLEEDVARSLPELKENFVSRFQIIHGELNRLEGLVKQFVSLSGPTALHLDTVEAGKLLHNVTALLEPEAAARSITMTAEFQENLTLRADSGQLMQALVNLAINAIQAVESGGAVSLRARAEGGRLFLEVQDTGPGVEPGRRSAIFEPFYTTKPEGSGLGLWIVQQIVSAHGGVIHVRNATPRGALFAIELPLDQA